MNYATALRNRYSFASNLVLLPLAPLTGGCVVEQIDALIADRGVTECSSSTGESSDSSGASTDTSTGSETSASESGSSTDSSSGENTHDGSGSGSSSTGPAPSVCGDGEVEGDETCDDGNTIPGDGCQECAKDSIIFISSETYKGFALGGLYGADQRCRGLAAKAGLENPLTFTAWLSTPAMSAADRLLHSRGRYVLVNGLVVAQNWDALTSGVLDTPIMVDEHSMTQEALAWTGTLASGQPALGSEFCEDWDDDSGLLKFSGVGLSASTDSTWSYLGEEACETNLHLYCIEQ